MKRFLRYATLALFLFAATVAPASQVEENENAAQELKATEEKLAAVLQQVRETYKGDTKFLRALEKSQVAWANYRDAQLNLVFPNRDERLGYGTVFPMCWSVWKAKLITSRIDELKQWIHGIAEGDVCGGSIRVHEPQR